MLITKNIEIKTTNKNITHYKKYFPDIKSGDVILITPEMLPTTSKILVKVKCDICEKEYDITYYSYLRNIFEYGYYSCKGKCAMEKNIKTNMIKFGDEYYQKTDEYSDRVTGVKKIKYYEDTDLIYKNEYELDFLKNYCDKLNITMFDNFFYIEDLNLIIEINNKNEVNMNHYFDLGYNFVFIVDKDYRNFDYMCKHLLYKPYHCWQYDLRLKTLEEDLSSLYFDPKDLRVGDFKFKYIDSKDIEMCSRIKDFIIKYEWLGKMPNRPTHRFVAMYDDIIVGVIIMSIPNAFSKMLGEKTKDIEKLISRGAVISWAPKNLNSALVMFSIRWMVKNTEFRLFSAYSDTDALELGTIYQACNFYYIGQNYGSNVSYLDLNKPELGWVSSRTFRKRRYYKMYSKKIGIEWQSNWENGTRMLWGNIPDNIEKLLREYSKEYQKKCLVRKCKPKHKYIYILGSKDSETKRLRKEFLSRNKIFEYPKR